MPSRTSSHLAVLVLVAGGASLGLGLCPGRGLLPDGHPGRPRSRSSDGGEGLPSSPPLWTDRGRARSSATERFAEALLAVDFEEVKADIRKVLVDSQAWWPADYGNYGPFFIRLAWHCSGSYRQSDGRGGCGGGRQRFDPERSWEDNTNLDKARALLWPVKEKHGVGLSWGDLFILAGNTAVESLGGPILGFCAGRVDDADGSASDELGPTPLQEKMYPCAVEGDCKEPLGSTTVGLIYLNPEGPQGNPIPEGSAPQIRDSFGRMGMNDSETVALIGGGHAFGKTHGACPNGAGLPPNEDPINPWPGLCGSGSGNDTFTSGFEGPWTADPLTWDNNYFKYLIEFEWEVHKGPADSWQWRVTPASGPAPTAPGVAGDGTTQDVMMLTSDISLTRDPANLYQPIVAEFAADIGKFNTAFAHAWYKLTTRDMGPVTRCMGPDVPPAQPWQHPLPPPGQLADFNVIRQYIELAILTDLPAFPADRYDGVPNYGPLFVRLAWQCTSTFRATDYLGGCNGARIRFAPERDWAANVDLDNALQVLEPIKREFGDTLSWADLIVLAGTVALEQAGSKPLTFCGGRTDALDGDGSTFLSQPVTGAFTDTADMLAEAVKLIGLTSREFVVLMGGGHSLGRMHVGRSGFEGAWTFEPTRLSNEYFRLLLDEQWQPHTVAESRRQQYKAAGKDLYMLKTDLMLRYEPALAAVAQELASDNNQFLDEFADVWTKFVNADRFRGPTGNLCHRNETTGASAEARTEDTAAGAGAGTEDTAAGAGAGTEVHVDVGERAGAGAAEM